MKIESLPDYMKPREKAFKYGINTLNNTELLAIILRCGNKNENVIEVSNNLLVSIPNLNYLYDISLNELTTIKGIGNVKAIEILAIIELYKRMNLEKQGNYKLASSEVVYKLIKPKIINLKQEHFFAIYLNTKSILIEIKEISIGNINSTKIDIDEVIRWYYKLKASAIIIVHNHPSGIVIPSNEDIELTMKLYNHLNNLKICLIDHLIVSENDYYSFIQNHLIK